VNIAISKYPSHLEEVKTNNVQGRKKILNWEQNEVDQHYQQTGETAPGQKRPKPTGT